MKPTRENSPGGFTLVELLVAIGTVILLVAILFPQLPRSHVARQRIHCISNLKQIGLSFRTWALDYQGRYPMQVDATNGGSMEFVNTGLVFPHFLVLSNELVTPRILICPDDTRPAIKNATSFFGPIASGNSQIPFTNDNQVSYFIGVDADSTQPSLFLCGDRNLAIGGLPVRHGLQAVWTNSTVAWTQPGHSRGTAGNIGLADGSVQQVSTSGLRTLLVQTGVATNRLAIP